MIRQIDLQAIDSDVFQVVTFEGDEIVKLHYSKQIDDMMITVRGGDVLLSWDTEEWNDTECILLSEKDNLKEINKISCTHILMKSRDGNKVTAYTVAQLN